MGSFCIQQSAWQSNYSVNMLFIKVINPTNGRERRSSWADLCLEENTDDGLKFHNSLSSIRSCFKGIHSLS